MRAADRDVSPARQLRVGIRRRPNPDGKEASHAVRQEPKGRKASKEVRRPGPEDQARSREEAERQAEEQPMNCRLPGRAPAFLVSIVAVLCCTGTVVPVADAVEFSELGVQLTE